MNAVLLVDDERDFADLLAERLRARGFAVQTAYDGEEALRLAAEGELDVAVLDVNLPGIDGLALLRELKLARPRAEAVMLTGQNDLATAVAGMKLGATDYLVKPVPIERLVEAILRAQERRQERQEGLRMAETAKMAALGHMAEGVAHEINNPVNTMVSLAGWLTDLVDDLRQELNSGMGDVTAGTLAEMRQSVDKLRDQGLRCKRITAKLLCLCHKANGGSQSDGGQPEPAAALPGGGVRVEPGVLLTGLLEERRERIAQNAVTVHWSPPQDLPTLLLPAQDLPGADVSTALGNILDNALDAMPTGGVLTVLASVAEASEAVLPEVAPIGRELRIQVKDTGHGILPKHLPRVFEPFFSTREVGQGTGLGLSVSYGTLKSLGGDIEISSPPGQGVTVLVRLPL
jgi:signal transduction histidine kinase